MVMPRLIPHEPDLQSQRKLV